MILLEKKTDDLRGLVVDECNKFTAKTIDGVHGLIAKIANQMPDRNSVQDRTDVVNGVIDSLVGSVCFIAISLGGTDSQLEDSLCAGIRSKFDDHRKEQEARQVHESVGTIPDLHVDCRGRDHWKD